MNPLDVAEVVGFVEKNIADFHRRRVESLLTLKLKKVLKRKNPYLFRAKNMITAQELVQSLLDAHLSSQEETLFGEFLEKLAIFISGEVFGGQKSSAEGIDLDFTRDGIRYLVAIKSGPNWGNSSQINKMRDNFRKAERILRTNRGAFPVRAINGCCYGQDANPDKGDYEKLCGQRFWEFISGNANLYLEIIEPLGHRAREQNDVFREGYAQIINRFTAEFLTDFCHDGKIGWDLLVQYNSAAERP